MRTPSFFWDFFLFLKSFCVFLIIEKHRPSDDSQGRYDAYRAMEDAIEAGQIKRYFVFVAKFWKKIQIHN